uniref:TLC domain-containing protein n=1 Tax=Panagrellus redivivus TaxID=6233 RepID=A0A7E4VVW9_PANRE
MIRPEYNLTDPFIYRVPTVDYITCVKLCSQSLAHYLYRFPKVFPNYRFPDSFFEDLKNIDLTCPQLALVCFVAFLLTIGRHYFVKQFVLPLMPLLGVPILHRHKFPECIWKFLYYLVTWSFSLYVHIFSGRYRTFQDPLSVWESWHEGYPPRVYWDIHFIYVTQAAFYVHSIYATLYMDIWRKDSTLMCIHHFIALALIGLSYGSGHVLEGAFVVFLHDNTDMMLELTKLSVYLKKRENGEYYPWLNVLGNVSFVSFAIMWFVFRLYWYPLKLLYMTVYGGVYLGPQDSPFYAYLGIMLMVLLFMNIYWFNFIVRMVIRVCQTGEEPEDNREFDTVAVSGIPKEKLSELARVGKLAAATKEIKKKGD